MFFFNSGMMSTAEHPCRQMKKQRVKLKFNLPYHWWFSYFEVETEALALLIA